MAHTIFTTSHTKQISLRDWKKKLKPIKTGSINSVFLNLPEVEDGLLTCMAFSGSLLAGGLWFGFRSVGSVVDTRPSISDKDFWSLVSVWMYNGWSTPWGGGDMMTLRSCSDEGVLDLWLEFGVKVELGTRSECPSGENRFSAAYSRLFFLDAMASEYKDMGEWFWL